MAIRQQQSTAQVKQIPGINSGKRSSSTKYRSTSQSSRTRLEIDKLIVQHQDLQQKQLQQLNVNFIYQGKAGKTLCPSVSPSDLQLAGYHHAQTALFCAKFSARWRERSPKDLRPHLRAEGAYPSVHLMDMVFNNLPWNNVCSISPWSNSHPLHCWKPY